MFDYTYTEVYMKNFPFKEKHFFYSPFSNVLFYWSSNFMLGTKIKSVQRCFYDAHMQTILYVFGDLGALEWRDRQLCLSRRVVASLTEKIVALQVKLKSVYCAPYTLALFYFAILSISNISFSSCFAIKRWRVH